MTASYPGAIGAGVQVFINGQSREVGDGVSIRELLEELGELPARVAVEVNQVVIRKAHHAEHRLSAGDHIEIVTLVGGG